MTYNVFGGTLNLALSISISCTAVLCRRFVVRAAKYVCSESNAIIIKSYKFFGQL